MDSDIFRFIKEKLHEEVPLYLQNILKYSGYDNKISLANISDEEISYIELFAKTQLKSILRRKANIDYKSIYHLYSENIDEFIILPGHKKLLLAVGSVCADENNAIKVRESFFNEGKRRKTILPAACLSEDSVLEPAENLNVDISEDKVREMTSTLDEYKYVYEICRQWIKKFMDTYLTEPEQNKLVDTIRRLEVRISPSTQEDTLYFAYVRCCICQTEIKTQKRLRREGNSTWLISNFYKHFKFHFADKPGVVDKRGGNQIRAHKAAEEESDSLGDEPYYTEYENNFKQEMQD